MVLHDRLWRYREKLDQGEVDADLDQAERAAVSRLLMAAITILDTYGATPADHLARMCRDETVPPRVNERVAKIISEA